MSLRVRWRARLIHPWDRDLPTDTTERLLVEQSFADTEAALHRLFTTLPEIDIIELRVLDPVSEQTIMAGIVRRSDLEAARCFASVKMRLGESGVDFRLTGSRFSALGAHHEQESLSMRIE